MAANEIEIVVSWNGPGWYGPIQRGQWESQHISIDKVATDAGRNDYNQASRDAYGQVGTPTWCETEEDCLSV